MASRTFKTLFRKLSFFWKSWNDATSRGWKDHVKKNSWKNSLLWQVPIFIDALYWKIFPIYFKIVGYLKERGFDKEVLRKVRESQVSYFVSLYNVTISLSILGLRNNSMNRSTSSGEDWRACDFSDEKSFIEGAIWHLNFYCFI